MQNPNDFPMREMMGARAAGMNLRSFLELDAQECDLWMEYAMMGPTEARTQILISQLIQTVQGALGGKPPPIDTLIPWHRILMKKEPVSKKDKMLEQQRMITNIMLDRHEKKKKEI